MPSNNRIANGVVLGLLSLSFMCFVLLTSFGAGEIMCKGRSLFGLDVSVCLGIGTVVSRVSGKLNVPSFTTTKRAELEAHNPLESSLTSLLEHEAQMERDAEEQKRDAEDVLQGWTWSPSPAPSPRPTAYTDSSSSGSSSSGSIFGGLSSSSSQTELNQVQATSLAGATVDSSLESVKDWSIVCVVFFAGTLFGNFAGLVYSAILFGAEQKQVFAAFIPTLTFIVFALASLFYFLAWMEFDTVPAFQTIGKAEPGLGLLWYIVGLSSLFAAMVLGIIAHYCMPQAEVVNSGSSKTPAGPNSWSKRASSNEKWSKRASGSGGTHLRASRSRHSRGPTELKNSYG